MVGMMAVIFERRLWLGGWLVLGREFRIVSAAIALLALVSGRAYAQADSSAQLRGRVTTRMEIPLPLAEVTVLGTEPKTVMTDSAGRFLVRELPVGQHVVRVRRVGFKPQYLSATLVAGEAREFNIILEAGAYELPEVKVTARLAKPIEYAWTTKYDEFFRRRQVGLGKFITREDFEKTNPYRTSSILFGIPGIHVRFSGHERTEIWFTGCNHISVWIDGFQVRINKESGSGMQRRSGAGPTPAEIGELISRILPSQIELVEVYSGPARMPAEYLGDSCAAIAFWTR
jgi:hypothetical protein